MIKIGGSLLHHVRHLDHVLSTVSLMAAERRLLLVPGGGLFADAVRHADRTLGLGDEAAHWMAILAMDQVAYAVADRLADGHVVRDPAELEDAFRAGRIAVLAPYRWLREADPLAHSWDVTSDSIAAWVAGQLNARELMLVKAPGAAGDHLVDAAFRTVVPRGLDVRIVTADSLSILRWHATG